MNKRTIVGVFSMALVLVGCSQQQGASQSSASPLASASAEATGTMSQGQVKEFTVTGSNFKFDPAEIRVKKGDVVKITFKSVDGFHDFDLPDFTVESKKLAGGQEEVIQFVADKTGTFEYFCSVANHRQMGMKGNLIVE